MKKILLILFLFIPLSLSSQNKFDMINHLGFKIGDSQDKVISLLQARNCEVKAKNNDVGTKYYLVLNYPERIFDNPLSDYRLAFKKKKLYLIYLEYADISTSDFNSMIEPIDDSANSKFDFSDEDGLMNLNFDNCSMLINKSEQWIKILKKF